MKSTLMHCRGGREGRYCISFRELHRCKFLCSHGASIWPLLLQGLGVTLKICFFVRVKNEIRSDLITDGYGKTLFVQSCTCHYVFGRR